MGDITIKQVAEAIGAPDAAAKWAENMARWNSIYACEKTTDTIQLADGTYSRRKRSLSMGKRGCEDWASLLWTENSELTTDDAEAEVISGFLGDDFDSEFAEFLEAEVFAAGFGAIDVMLDGLKVSASGEVSADASTTMTRDLVPADSIIPLKWHRSVISEVAFVSWEASGVTVREHRKTPTGYRIVNRAFRLAGQKLSEVEVPEGIAPFLDFPGAPPLFAILRPATKNNIDKRSPFGISVLANAEDQLEVVDLVYDNLANDFRLGSKKVFILDTMLRRGTPTTEHPGGVPILPDKSNSDMYIVLRDSQAEGKNAISEHNPALRVADNTTALDAALSLFSTAIGMGAERYVYRGETVATATQIVSENSELFRNRRKHLTAIESALVQVCRGALWIAANLMGAIVNYEADITLTADDSVIEDDTARISRGLLLVDRVISKRMFLTDYMGLTPEAADTELAAMRGELPTLI
jgi:A118 family predicted phage portal protein